MSSSQATNQDCIKLIQIYQYLKSDKSSQSLILSKIQAILKSNFNINYRLPFNIYTFCNKTQYLGNTALHFMIEFNRHIWLDLLMNHGADLSLQNNNGYSPLLLAFHKGFDTHRLLLLYIEKKIFTNIKDKNGISHFHVACSNNNLQAVDIYLEAGTSIHESVNNGSPKYPGYTPLHFAALHGQLRVIEFLIANGANMNSKDVYGTTPLHLLIKECKNRNFNGGFFIKIFPLTILPDDIGLTNLHINCTMNYGSLFKRSLNQDIDVDSPIKFDSPVWPGYTPLHVASQFNLSTVIRLLEKGANLLAKDANGTSPLDLCLKQYNLDEIIQILSTEKRYCLSRIKFTDGMSLFDVLHTMKDSREFQQFIKEKVKNINTVIPSNSLLWPGYNLLHLTVMFNQNYSIHSVVSSLMSSNIDFTMLNADGMSPLQLAFYWDKKYFVESILDFHEKIPANPVDQTGLSHFHIACAARNIKAIKCLLNSGSDPNLMITRDIQNIFKKEYLFNTGITPFDIAVNWLNIDLMEKTSASEKNLNVLYIHSCPCCLHNDSRENEKCEIIIDCMLKPEVKALMTNSTSFKILNNALIYNYESNAIYTKVINKLVNEMRFEELGLTKLQVACALGELAVVKEELESGASVNQQIAFDSSIWPGDTALHVNSRRKEFASRTSRIEIAQLLLEYGANPNIKNVNNLTPVHLSDNLELEEVILSNKIFPIVNPVNNDGLSHFHLSCKTSNLNLVKEFIKSGANVHTPVNYFADLYAGYAPLHFAIQYGSKEVIELLLSQGVNPNVKNADGLTPFHLAVTHNVNQDQMEALLRSPLVDIESKDMTGKPVLIEALDKITDFLKKCKPKEITINEGMIISLLNKGVYMSFADLIVHGYVPKLVQATQILSMSTFSQLINNVPDITDNDENGQNIMHYISNYEFKKEPLLKNFNTLVRSGCEINRKDNKGKTPLHIAVICDYQETVVLLLRLGADINIKDDKKMTPLCYAVKESKKLNDDPDNDWGPWEIESQKDLFQHIEHLDQVGLYIDKLNKKHFDNSEIEEILLSNRIINSRRLEKQKLQNKFKKEVNPSLSVDYFFTERFVVDYKKISILQRHAIRNICESDNLFKEFPEMHNLIRLQFRKARSRTRLLKPAMSAFCTLLDRDIPDLCLESILNYLNNDDIMNLVRSGNGDLVFSPLLENY